MANGIHTKLKRILISPSFLGSDPIWVYAIACRMELDEVAKLAIQHTYQLDLIRDISPPLLQAMTIETYNRLLRSHAARRDQLAHVVERTEYPKQQGCFCGANFYKSLTKKITFAIWKTPVLDRQRLDSFLSHFDDPKSTCGSGSSCMVSARAVSSYFTSILNGIGKLAPVPDH